MDLDLTPEEITVIRMAMAIHSASKKPQLTWSGWKHLAVALAIGSERAQRKAKTTNLKDYQYRMLMGQFLRKTGFIFINKYDRSIAVRMLDKWDEIDAWRNTLTESRRKALNNPKDIWEAYQEDQKALVPLEERGPRPGGKKRLLPSMLEQVAALEEACAAAEERRDRAEAEADYFADLAQEIAGRAKLRREGDRRHPGRGPRQARTHRRGRTRRRGRLIYGSAAGGPKKHETGLQADGKRDLNCGATALTDETRC